MSTALGFFCSVAMELERKGIFDWGISDSFERVISLIKNGFKDHFGYKSLYKESIPNHYYNMKIGIHFIMIPRLKPLISQVEAVDRNTSAECKYIKEPIFFRKVLS